MAPSKDIHRTLLPPRHGSGLTLGHVSEAGEIRYAGPRPAWRRFRTFGSFATVLLTRGGGTYEDANGLRLDVAAGDLILVFPDLPHAYRPTAPEGWTELFLVFAGPVFDAWVDHGVLDPRRPVLRLGDPAPWRTRSECVIEAVQRGDRASALLALTRVQSMLAEALSVAGVEARGAAAEPSWLRQAKAALGASLDNGDTDLEALAAELRMSYASFRRRFREATGMSPGRYRAARVIDRACELIATGGLSDKEIAHALGFCDAFHFSKRFKQITGRTPTQYREGMPWLGRR